MKTYFRLFSWADHCLARTDAANWIDEKYATFGDLVASSCFTESAVGVTAWITVRDGEKKPKEI